jgi:hypothetical protein
MLRHLHHLLRTPRWPSFRPRVEHLENRDTPSTTLLTVTPNPATVGQAVTLTATITESGTDILQPGTGDAPAGSVTFMDGSVTLMTVKVSPKTGTTTQGTAQFTTSGLMAGTHSLTAAYSGENIFFPATLFANPSTSPAVSETINPVPPTPTPAPPAITDVTPMVSVREGKILPGNQQLVTVTNSSGQEISGPLYLVFTKLPKHVRLRGGSGTTHSHAPGSPFLLDEVTLLPGGFVNFLASFSGRKAGHLPTKVFAGPGSL